MFGEVFDTTRPVHVAIHDREPDAGGPGLPVPGRRDATSRRGGRRRPSSQAFFAADDWYTDADSNVYQLPTFLGNHDMGRIGWIVQRDNPGAGDAEWVARDRLAHELMYFSRGQPGRVLRRRAGLHRQRRRPGRTADDVRQPGAGLPRRRPARHRRNARGGQLRPDPTRCTRAISRAGRRDAGASGAARRRAPASVRGGRGRDLRVLPDRRRPSSASTSSR